MVFGCVNVGLLVRCVSEAIHSREHHLSVLAGKIGGSISSGSGNDSINALLHQCNAVRIEIAELQLALKELSQQSAPRPDRASSAPVELPPNDEYCYHD